MVGFGRTSGGWSTDKYYQPPLEHFIFELAEARHANVTPATKLPCPAWGCDVQLCFKAAFSS